MTKRKKSPLLEGVIVRFSLKDGYGFILPSEKNPGPQVFLHITALNPGYGLPSVGDKVRFRVILDKGKWRATRVSRC